jgi:sulfide:quinone oxidoreductase
MTSSRRVVICGGGVAAIEALLALRAHLEVGVDVHLVAPNDQFVYQPLAVAEPFGLARTDRFELAQVAAEKGATLHADALASVDGESGRVRLASGEALAYDVLVVAVGAVRRDWLRGALHFAGAAEVSAFEQVLERLVGGSVRRLCFVQPAQTSWELPLYELALLTASRMADAGVIGAQLTVVTPEADPLAMFGPAAAKMLRDLLADRGIALKAGVCAEGIEGGRLRLDSRAALEVDQVVTLARLQGPALAGLPADASGFIVVDEHSRVAGLEDVYAAGDGTSFPIKQGGIATQQADVAAEAIAARLGAALTPSALEPTLRAMLLTGIAPTYLRAQAAGAAGGSFEIAANPLWWPPGKIAGRYLAPYLAGHRPLTGGDMLEDRPPVSEGSAGSTQSHEQARELAMAFAERDAADGHFKSALEWLDVLERIDGVLPPGYLDKRARWQDRAQPRARA